MLVTDGVGTDLTDDSRDCSFDFMVTVATEWRHILATAMTRNTRLACGGAHTHRVTSDALLVTS